MFRKLRIKRSTAFVARHRSMAVEMLESRLTLSAVGFVSQEVAPESDGLRITSMDVGDLDGDGDMDVLVSEWDRKIAWYENIDGDGTFGSQHVVSTALGSVNSVRLVDVDGDLDLDIVAATGYSFPVDLEIVWYENTDGRGTFGTQNSIAATQGGFIEFYAADLDGDTDVDILTRSASLVQGGIRRFENVNGLGTYEERDLGASDSVNSLHVADMEGDGDLDVFTTSNSTGEPPVAWYENIGGVFDKRQTISVTEAFRAVFADMDSDGDIDVLSDFAWHDNRDGKFGHTIEAEVVDNIMLVADVDHDGDIDVIQRAYIAEGMREEGVVWCENADSLGTFEQCHLISREMPRTPAADYGSNRALIDVADLDGDGDLDVLSATDDGRITWHEQLLRGDVEDNGTVDFEDFLVLSNNFGRNDASWEEGDFSDDQLVNFADFLILAANFGEVRSI